MLDKSNKFSAFSCQFLNFYLFLDEFLLRGNQELSYFYILLFPVYASSPRVPRFVQKMERFRELIFGKQQVWPWKITSSYIKSKTLSIERRMISCVGYITVKWSKVKLRLAKWFTAIYNFSRSRQTDRPSVISLRWPS